MGGEKAVVHVSVMIVIDHALFDANIPVRIIINEERQTEHKKYASTSFLLETNTASLIYSARIEKFRRSIQIHIRLIPIIALFNFIILLSCYNLYAFFFQ